MCLIFTCRSLQHSRAMQEVSTEWSLTAQIDTRSCTCQAILEGGNRQAARFRAVKTEDDLTLSARAEGDGKTPEDGPLVVTFRVSHFRKQWLPQAVYFKGTSKL